MSNRHRRSVRTNRNEWPVYNLIVPRSYFDSTAKSAKYMFLDDPYVPEMAIEINFPMSWLTGSRQDSEGRIAWYSNHPQNLGYMAFRVKVVDQI